jgi:hypothetical protein
MNWDRKESDGLNLLNRKTSREINEYEINLCNKYQKLEKERCIQIKGDNKQKESKINRDKGEKIIYDILSDVLNNNIINNENILEKYEQYKNNEIYNLIQSKDTKLSLLSLKTLAHQIEENLFNLYKNKSSSYYNFLQDFHKCQKNEFDLVIKVIFGAYTPEEISKFKDDDFLSEEQKREKEEKKKIEIKKIYLKGDKEVKLTLNKGRMLSEKEIYIEDKNNNVDLFMKEQNEEIDERYDDDKVKKFKEKLKNKKAEFPHLKSEDIKMLIDLANPNEEYIKDRLNNLIKEKLEVGEQNEFFDIRKNILKKEAERRIKNSEKNKNKNINDKENINLIVNDENDNKIDNCIKNISFDIRYFGMN